MRTEPCPSARELEDHLLGRLPPGRAAVVGRHLDGCGECPARVDALQVQSRLMRVLADMPPTGVLDDENAAPRPVSAT